MARRYSEFSLVGGFLLLFVPPALYGQSPDTLVRAMATVTRRDSAGRRELAFLSQRYHFPRWYQRGDSAPSHIALLETSEQHCCLGGERDTYGTITLSAWRNAPNSGPPLWRASIIADDGGVWEQYFRTTVFGCCDTSNEFAFFNLLTGGPLFVATEVRGDSVRSVRHLRVPGSSLERVIAFHDTWTVHKPPEALRDSLLLGVLQYGSPRGPIARIYVTRTSVGTDYRLTDVRFVIKGKEEPYDEADLWSANASEDPRRLAGFSIQVRLAAYADNKADAVLTFPVVEDRIDLAHATIPRGLRVGRSDLRPATTMAPNER